MHRTASTQRERHFSGLRYTIPYHLRRDNTRNIAVVHTYVHPKRRTKRGLLYKEGQKKTEEGLKEAKKERDREEMKREERKTKTKPKSSCMHSGRRPSTEETRLLFAGVISRVICPADGPTEKRDDTTRPDGRQLLRKKKRGRTELNISH